MKVLTECPACHRRWPVEEEQLGQEISCPDCGQRSAAANIGVPPGVRKHRANLVFGLGIASLVLVGLFGPFAWYMAGGDLKRMERGEMDPSGYANTKAALVMGRIGAAKCVLEILFIVVAVGLILALALYATD